MPFYIKKFKTDDCHSVDEILEKSRSSFKTAFYLLPPARRHALKVFYAFCRSLDDAVDEDTDIKRAESYLSFWREEIDRIKTGGKLSPLGGEIKNIVCEFALSLEPFKLLIEGVEMDLKKNRYNTFQELYDYCYRVGSSVGFFCVELSGIKTGSAMRYAELTGIGVQMTNILRDIKEDSLRNRIYIPAHDMKMFNVEEKDILHFQLDEKVINLLNFEAIRAKTFFNIGGMTLPTNEAIKLYFCHFLSGTYEALLQKLIDNNYGFGINGDVKLKIKVTTGEKISAGIKTLIKSAFWQIPYF